MANYRCKCESLRDKIEHHLQVGLRVEGFPYITTKDIAEACKGCGDESVCGEKSRLTQRIEECPDGRAYVGNR